MGLVSSPVPAHAVGSSPQLPRRGDERPSTAPVGRALVASAAPLGAVLTCLGVAIAVASLFVPSADFEVQPTTGERLSISFDVLAPEWRAEEIEVVLHGATLLSVPPPWHCAFDPHHDSAHCSPGGPGLVEGDLEYTKTEADATYSVHVSATAGTFRVSGHSDGPLP